MTTYPVKLLKDKDGTAFIPIVNSDSIITPNGDTLDDLLDEKQDTLISGTNLKTINNQSLLGEGNIDVSGGSGTPTDVRVNNTSITSSGVANIVTEGTYNSSSNKIVTKSYADNLVNNKVDEEYSNGTINMSIDNSNDLMSLSASDSNTGKSALVLLDPTPGSITMEGDVIYINGIATPTDDADAVNKKYVDDLVGDIESLLGGI